MPALLCMARSRIVRPDARTAALLLAQSAGQASVVRPVAGGGGAAPEWRGQTMSGLELLADAAVSLRPSRGRAPAPRQLWLGPLRGQPSLYHASHAADPSPVPSVHAPAGPPRR